MARLVMILGTSGSGKSTSLRNLTEKDVQVISVLGKELPFRTNIKTYHPKSYDDVLKAVGASKAPIVVIDDTNFLMSKYEFATINESGYAKFSRNADNMVKVFETIIDKDSDQTFYVLAHSEKDEDGNITFKTTGKMVADKYPPNGITNIVLEAAYNPEEERFVFRTKADGHGVKTPIGMFETDEIDNDLASVNKTINEYYGGK